MDKTRGFWLLLCVNLLLVLILVFLLLDPLAWLNLKIRLDKPVDIAVEDTLQIRTHIEEDLQVSLPKLLNAEVAIDQVLSIPVDQTLQLPLDFSLDVNLQGSLDYSATSEIDFQLPIDLPLNQNSLSIETLWVTLDEGVYIEDEIEIDMLLPINTEVTTLAGIQVPVEADIPVRARIPIRQQLKVSGPVQASVQSLQARLTTAIPVRATLPIRGRLNLAGNTVVPVRKNVTVPLKETFVLPLTTRLPVEVALNESLPVGVSFQLDTPVALKDELSVLLQGEFTLMADDLRFEMAAEGSRSTTETAPQ